jgi:hypothetical protein
VTLEDLLEDHLGRDADELAAVIRTWVIQYGPELVGLERWGTWLDPRSYGGTYDHHTFTKCPTVEGVAVAVYRLPAWP